MTDEIFASQIDRLKEVWPNAFPKPRLALIHNAVKRMPDFWMETTCNRFVGDLPLNRPPVLRDFIEAMKAHELEEHERRKNADQGNSGIVQVLEKAEEKVERTSDRDFASLCVKVVRQYVAKQLTPKQFDEACKMLAKTAREMNPSVCRHCDQSGIVFAEDENGSSRLYRCPCRFGKEYDRDMFAPSDKERQHPFRFAVYQPKLEVA